MNLHWITRRWLPALVASGVLAGCARDARSLTLDENKARDSVIEFLETWKNGGKVEELKPRITGFDAAWDSGRKLVAYELLPDAKNDGANLHVTIAAVFEGKDGKEAKSEIQYIVGTQPVITIFRP